MATGLFSPGQHRLWIVWYDCSHSMEYSYHGHATAYDDLIARYFKEGLAGLDAAKSDEDALQVIGGTVGGCQLASAELEVRCSPPPTQSVQHHDLNMRMSVDHEMNRPPPLHAHAHSNEKCPAPAPCWPRSLGCHHVNRVRVFLSIG